MDADQLLKKFVSSFERYYNIRIDDVTEPFTAEADFKSHNEQYVLVKAAKIADIDSNEYVYLKIAQEISAQEIEQLAEQAWNAGVSRVKPYYGHRNSDVTLLIITDAILSEKKNTKKTIKKLKYSKSYKMTLWGWSNFRVAVKELSSGQIHTNRLGSDLKKVLAKIN